MSVKLSPRDVLAPTLAPKRDMDIAPSPSSSPSPYPLPRAGEGGAAQAAPGEGRGAGEGTGGGELFPADPAAQAIEIVARVRRIVAEERERMEELRRTLDEDLLRLKRIGGRA